MTKKFLVGTLYKIKFYDHSIGIAEKMICETVGWVISTDSIQLVLTNWRVLNSDKEIREYNIEPVSIIKSCIISSRKY